MRFREKMASFFAGRNGTDQLSRFFLWFSVAVIVLSLVFSRFVSATVGSALWMVGLLCLVYSYFRILSRNIYKRQQENQRYLDRTAKIRGWFKLQRDKIKYRKDFAFFSCPSCKAVLRVPRGKGKLKIKCHKCGELFIRNT